MSRVGKLPITIPQGVDISLNELLLTIKGPKGTLARQVPEDIEVHLEKDAVQVRRRDDSNKSRSLHGLVRALVNNMVQGVSQGFVIGLEIQGTGYRADAQNNVLNLSLGYSHPIQFVLPEGIKGSVERKNVSIIMLDSEGAAEVMRWNLIGARRRPTRLLGGGPGVQDFVRKHEADWKWWGEQPDDMRRPLVSLDPLRSPPCRPVRAGHNGAFQALRRPRPSRHDPKPRRSAPPRRRPARRSA